jgi:hypothetical protein
MISNLSAHGTDRIPLGGFLVETAGFVAVALFYNDSTRNRSRFYGLNCSLGAEIYGHG